jgi:hypothetical protein
MLGRISHVSLLIQHLFNKNLGVETNYTYSLNTQSHGIQVVSWVSSAIEDARWNEFSYTVLVANPRLFTADVRQLLRHMTANRHQRIRNQLCRCWQSYEHDVVIDRGKVAKRRTRRPPVNS